MSIKMQANGTCLLKPKPCHPTPQKEIGADYEHEYSDGGYPTLPRPKAILSIPRPGSPWSVDEASRLQTVSVRLHGRAGTTSPASVRKSNGECTGITYVNSKEPVQGTRTCDIGRASTACGKLEVNGTRNHSPLMLSSSDRVANSRETDAKSSSLPRSLTPELTTMSQAKAKKSRRPTRALTFSFGSSSSEKRRRTLNLFGTLRRRPSPEEGDSTLRIPITNAMAPSSPILVGKRRSRTLPSTMRTTSSIQQQSIQEEMTSTSSIEDHPCSNGTTVVQSNSCRDFNGVQSTGARNRVKNASLQSLVDVSPGVVSSLRESIESLTYSAQSEATDTPPSTPSSSQQSPNLRRSQIPLPREGVPAPASPRPRKLSDPGGRDSPVPEQDHGEGIQRSPRVGHALKKGHSFCVSQSRNNKDGPNWREMRHHVVRFLLETEQSYVQSLRTIIKVYLEPLKRPQAAGLADPNLVGEVFYQIPEICSLHEKFLAQVSHRVDHWHPLQKIGDIFVNTFSKCQLMDIYSKFIQNFMRAKAATEIAKQARPMFAKFLEQRAKDSQGKLSLDDLLIKPVQRIPRYVLFIKDLLKHTSVSHPDHSPLQQALGELTMLAERVNESQRESHRIERQRELLVSIEGLALLLNSQSILLRYDLMTEIKGSVQKKDRFLILFSDMVVCASARRKSIGFKRGSLLNLNSVLPETLRYKIKWHAPLTEISMAQVQAPMFERRRQNTLEKLVENMKKDETVLQQILDLSGSLQRPHQSLNVLLRDMLVEVKDGITEKKEELENLPHDVARTDLISYANNSPVQYSLIFPSQRICNSWEKEFLLAKKAADKQAPPSAVVVPAISPPPFQSNISHDLQFLHPLLLQSGRIGTLLTCAAVGLPVDCDSSRCLWVCCSDGYGGQVCLLDLEHSTQPQLVANITVSQSKILCIAAITTAEGSSAKDGIVTVTEPPLLAAAEETDSVEKIRSSLSPAASKGNLSTVCEILPEIEERVLNSPVVEDAAMSSSDSSSELSSQASVSRTPSSASEEVDSQRHLRVARDNGWTPDECRSGGEENFLGPSPRLIVEDHDGTEGVFSFEGEFYKRPTRSLTRGAFRRVRSNSAPPDPERVLQYTSDVSSQPSSHGRALHPPSPSSHSPSPSLPRQTKNTLTVEQLNPRTTKSWSPLTLRPSSCMDDTEEDECSMWLGTEGGQLHIYSAGNNLRSRSQRQTVELGAPVHCIRCFESCVYVGLGNGSVALTNPQDPGCSGPRRYIVLGTDPVVCCVLVLGELWAACGGTIYQLDRKEMIGQVVVTLPSEQMIHSMVAIGNSVWVSVVGSPVLHLYHAPSVTLLTTVDCTRVVMDVLRSYDTIIRQHKSADLRITSLFLTPSNDHLLIGTSAGAILTLALPQLATEPHPLTHPPLPTHLPKGHVDNVHFLSSMCRNGTTLVLSGGSGFEDFVKVDSAQEIPETASCLLLWKTLT